MDEDAQPSTELDVSIEVKNSLHDTLDNDVVIINRTIPEVVISDNSCDCSSAFGDLSAVEKEPVEIDIKADVKAKTEDDQYDDFVVLDDDDSSQLPAVQIKQEQNGELNTSIEIEEHSLETNWNFAIKPENKSKPITSENDCKPLLENVENKTKAVEDAHKPKLEKLKASPNRPDVKLSVNSVNENSDVSIHCAPRPSLSSNETFVLQLDTTDALDSYLDKTTNDKELKNDPDSSNGGDCLADDMKENDPNNLNVPPAKVPEADSLILTADEELETEMSLVVRDKNEKMREGSTEQEKPDATILEKAQATKDSEKEVDKAVEAEPIPKIEPAKLLTGDVKKEDGTNSSDKRNALMETNKVASKADSKKIGVSTANGRKSDLQAGTSRILWVSNVTQSVKATDLKQYISKIGKVMTAKVVTDGKKCYGYVVMDNPDDATECLQTLNNAYFEGKRISLSLTRPPRSVPDKNKDISKPSEKEKSKSPKTDNVIRRNSCNETDDAKICKPKDAQPPKSDAGKRRRSPSSDKICKRRNSNDPLTTKFETKRRNHREYRQKSHSSDRHDQKYLRERMEKDRLKRKLMDEQRRNRDEMFRQMQREEKQREMEFRLEQERRKLQLERELFERERRELTRLDAERRKIEKERLEVLQQRSKLEEEFQKSRMKRKVDEFNLSSTIVKPPELIKPYDKRKEVSKSINNDCNYRKQYDKSSDSKHPFQKSSRDVRDDRKPTDSKNLALMSHRNVLKSDFASGKDSRGNSKSSKRGDDFKSYERSAPPPPKLNNDFDLSAGRKIKHSDHKHEYPDGKAHADRKPDRGGRKIEVIERKYYSERNNEGSDRKHERVYRKPEFDDRKPHSFPERKYEYGREVKRYREDGYPERDNPQRTQWPAPVNYNDPWKAGLQSAVPASSPVRYQDGNFSAPPYGGPSRIPPFYYHPTPQVQEYPRYDHCPQVTGRKY